MPFIRERPETEPFTVAWDGAEVDKEYFVGDLTDAGLVELLVLEISPLFFRRLVRQSVKVAKVGPAEWFATVHYSNKIDPAKAAGTDPQEPEHAEEGQH